MVNNQLLINFEPKYEYVFNCNCKRMLYKRFLVSENQLKNYVGEHNANTAILRHLKNGKDKTTIRLRKYGKIDIYNK